MFAPATTPVSVPISWQQMLDSWYETIAVPVGGLWIAGAFFLMFRLLGGYWLARRIRRVGVSPVPEQRLCRYWCEKLGIRQPVHWLESVHVRQPLTLGFWKPVVLFPAGLLLQLHPDEVEMLLLHELAHIRRHDYLVNLLQLALEVCFFYHPLFLLMSKDLRRYREYCCDDLVLQHAPDRLLYAKALTNLQLTHPFTQNQFAMHALGKSAFAQRISRLFFVRPDKAQRSPVLMVFLAFLLAGAAFTWSSFRTRLLPEPSELPIVFMEKNTAPATKTSNISPTTPLARLRETALDSSRDQSVPDSLAPAVVAVGADKMNVFYIGVDNPITVVVPGYKCADLSARLVGEGKLIPLADCRYTAVVTKPGPVSIEIYAREKGVEKLLGVRQFRVKRIPDPAESIKIENIHPKPFPEPLKHPLVFPLCDSMYTGRTPKPIPVESRNQYIKETTIDPNDQAAQGSPASIVLSVGADKMNVFYIGIDNPITIAVPGYQCSELSARFVGEGKLIPLADCRYSAVVTKPGTASVEVYASEQGVQKLLGVRQFKVKRIPDPVVGFENVRSNTIRKADIRAVLGRELQAQLVNFDFDTQCAITKFNVALHTNNADIVEYAVEGNTMPELILTQAEKLPEGSRIFIFDARTRCPGDSAPRHIGSIEFIIEK